MEPSTWKMSHVSEKRQIINSTVEMQCGHWYTCRRGYDKAEETEDKPGLTVPGSHSGEHAAVFELREPADRSQAETLGGGSRIKQGRFSLLGSPSGHGCIRETSFDSVRLEYWMSCHISAI